MNEIISIKDFQKGDSGFLVTINAGRNERPCIIEQTIKKVGRKYITMDMGYERKFENHNTSYLIENTTSGEHGQLFKSRKAAEDYIEADKIAKELSRMNTFNYCKCSLKQLQQIRAILIEAGVIK